MTCKAHRVNEQMHCSCGLQWDIDEDDPHQLHHDDQLRLKVKIIDRNIGLKAIEKMKEKLRDE